jgi:hypothetical protein
MDDDVDTDDDQLRVAYKHVIKELGDGMKMFSRNKKNVRNIHYINDRNLL